jgi:hypothetical protein
MIFYWLLFAIFAAINMQAGVVKTNLRDEILLYGKYRLAIVVCRQ